MEGKLKLNIQILLYTILIISLLANLLFIAKLLWNHHANQKLMKSETVITNAFSNLVNDPKSLLLNAIKGANQTLDIAIYNLQDKDIAAAILQAKKRGVSVRLITDAKKAEKSERAAILKSFTDNGIAVRTNRTQKMHLKMTTVDKTLVTTGSYNYSEASAYENQEQLLTIKNKELVKECTNHFTALWNSPHYEVWNK